MLAGLCLGHLSPANLLPSLPLPRPLPILVFVLCISKAIFSLILGTEMPGVQVHRGQSSRCPELGHCALGHLALLQMSTDAF